MTQPQPHNCFVDEKGLLFEKMLRFSHEAMATIFEIFIFHEDGRYAEQAAWAAFDVLCRLEAELSRFIDNSDISRINRSAVNQPVIVGLDTFESLKICRDLYKQTNGAFDITIGFLKDSYKKQGKIPKAAKENLRIGMNFLELNEVDHTVKRLIDTVKIDLGGFGKGYAVDLMAELLRDWGIDTALIHGGFSSVLALGCPPGAKGWPVTLSNPANRRQILASVYLHDRALGSSGLEKGSHIFDPHTLKPVKDRLAAWASVTDAATADALSTAFMVMAPDQVEQYCQNHLDTLAMLLMGRRRAGSQKEKTLMFGY